jgi:hypothetical protein
MIRGRPLRTFVTVTNNAGADLLRIASMSTCLAIASRSGLIASALGPYGDTLPLVNSKSFIELRHCRSSGPHRLRTMSDAAGCAIDSQNERSAFRA